MEHLCGIQGRHVNEGKQAHLGKQVRANAVIDHAPGELVVSEGGPYCGVVDLGCEPALTAPLQVHSMHNPLATQHTYMLFASALQLQGNANEETRFPLTV